MGDRFILIDLIDKLFNVLLIVLFLLQIKDNCAPNQRCEHSQFILHLLEFLPHDLMLNASLLILQLIGI